MKDFPGSRKNKKNIYRDGQIIKKASKFAENLDLYNQAFDLQQKGNFAQAAKIYNLLIERKYFNEKTFINFAIVCQNIGDPNNAIKLFREAVKINPKNYLPFFKMGFILNNNGNYYEAYPFAKRAIDLEPKLWQGHHNLIKILINLNRPKEAINFAMNAKNIFLKNHLFNGLLGDINSNIGNLEEAKKFYKAAISLKPNDYETLYSYANFSMGIGNKKESIKLLNKILEKNQNHTISYYSLSTIINVEEDEEIKNKILKMKSDDFKTYKDKYNILFSKSQIFHKLKDFEQSAEILKQANDLKLKDKPSNIDTIIDFSKNIKIKTSSDKSFNKPKIKSLRDIFIVGLPRSGSTLIESIIGMNKDVHNLGENSIFLNSLMESEKSNYSNLDELYLRYSNYFSSKKYTTNKSLSNYMYIPHLITKLKHSKVIYTFRNPLDNLLSMYRAKFIGIGNEYSSSLIDSAKYYIHQFEIMCFYREKYKKYIYFLDYDNLVNNPETEIRKLISWLGFNWEDSYLYPHKSQQAFFTASIVQVRSPINNKSVGGWKKYSKIMNEPLTFFNQSNFSLDSFKNLI